MGKKIDCPQCKGSGVNETNGKKIDCTACGGSGERDLG